MDVQQDEELTRGLREGNPDAWRAIYDAYAQAVWRFVARLLGSATADVPDVVQETFLAAARSAAGYDPARGSLWLWLCGIARRQVALHYRRQARHERLRQARDTLALASGNGQMEHWLEDRRVPPADVLQSVELAALVRAALVELSDDYGLLLTARYLEDVSVDEIAEAEKCTATAVRSRLARARQAFREKFSRIACGEFEEREGGSHEA